MNIKSLLLANIIGFIATGVLAQQSDIPDFLRNLDGLTYEGQVSGMDIYSTSGHDNLWLISPDGRTVIAGTILNDEGRDIGSVLASRPSVSEFENPLNSVISDYSRTKTPEDLIKEINTLTGKINELADVPPKIQDSFSDTIPGLTQNPEFSPMRTDIISPDSVIPADPEITSRSDAETVTNQAQAVLHGMSNEDKEILMKVLVGMLGKVTTEEEFKSVVDAWTSEVVRQYNQGLDISESADLIPSVSETDNSTISADTAIDTMPVLLEKAEPTQADLLLEEMRHDAMWFGIGKLDAPVVYAFIDPACPWCAKAIVSIGEAVTTGKLQLRIALVPIVSQDSPGLIASIMTAAEPPIAFMEHEYSKAEEGRNGLQVGNWSDLPGLLRTKLLDNVEMMKKYKLRGVPFFIFETEDGTKFINGVPEPEDFNDALPDSYRGTISGSPIQ